MLAGSRMSTGGQGGLSWIGGLEPGGKREERAQLFELCVVVLGEGTGTEGWGVA